MRSNKFRLLALFVVASSLAPALSLRAQDKDKKSRPRTVAQQPRPAAPTNDQVKEHMEPDDRSAPPRADVPVDTLANRQESMNDEAAQVVPYYNNYLAAYRLGPEDVISVSVFGLDRYSKTGITVPPNGVVALPLIPEGVFVVGKTTEQVGAAIAKKLQELVIDPR